MDPTGGWRGGGCVGLRSEGGSWRRGDGPALRRRRGSWDASARTRVGECECWRFSSLRFSRRKWASFVAVAVVAVVVAVDAAQNV